MSLSKATLVVLTFDQRELAVEAVQSALSQTYREYEVLVCIDAGDPETHRQVSELLGQESPSIEVTVIRPSSNRGPAWCYSEAVRQAEGEYISFLDGDDTWDHGMLQCQLAAIAGHPQEVAGVVGSAVFASGRRGGREEVYRPSSDMLFHEYLISHGANYPVLAGLYRTEMLRRALPIPSHYKVCDYWVASRVTSLGRLVPSDCMCGEVRAWAGSMLASGVKSELALDRLETACAFLSSSKPSVRRAAQARERRLLNRLLRNPSEVPIDRMRKYIAQRPLNVRARAVLIASWFARWGRRRNEA